MSFPNIPSMTPSLLVTTDQTVPLLLASIALEELALAHLINVEAEKLQAAIGSPLTPGGPVNQDLIAENLDQLLEANRSAEKMLRTIIKKEMLLQFKMEDVLDLVDIEEDTGACPCSLTTPIHNGFPNRAFPIVPPTIPSGIIVTINTSLLVFADICGGCTPEGNTFFYDFNRPAQLNPALPVFRQTFAATTFTTQCGLNNNSLFVTGVGNAAGTGTGSVTGINVLYALSLNQVANTLTLTLFDPVTGMVAYVQGPQPLPLDVVVDTCPPTP